MTIEDEMRTGISSAVQRMLRHRQRRRNGFEYFTVELRVTEIDRLVVLGYLKPDHRDAWGEIFLPLY